jgi:hypothetical protein
MEEDDAHTQARRTGTGGRGELDERSTVGSGATRLSLLPVGLLATSAVALSSAVAPPPLASRAFFASRSSMSVLSQVFRAIRPRWSAWSWDAAFSSSVSACVHG